MTKRILITGKNSYVGNQLADWLAKDPETYEVVKESVRDDKWKRIDFSRFDVVVHVAGIAHIKESKKNKHIYYSINTNLSYEIARKAKKSGVKQFIFLSSMSVYGVTEGVIDHKSPLHPTSAYGQSKLEAENLISELHATNFKVSVLRPPMVYGEKSKGNYSKLAKTAMYLPVIPKIKNKKSMIYTENLMSIIKYTIDNEIYGVLLPQNNEFVCTSEMIKNIREAHGKKSYFILIPKKVSEFLILNSILFRKIFGTLIYDDKLPGGPSSNILYDKVSFSESIKKSEGRA